MSTSSGAAYPDRPQLFALHFIKWLSDSGAAQEIGPEAFAVLVAVVTKEDDIRYQRAVNFFNEQLAERCGIVSVHALTRARTRAIKADLLVYEPSVKRRPGRYFVTGFHAQSAQQAGGKREESGRNPLPSSPNPKPIPIPQSFYCAPEAGADQELSDWITFWNELKTDGLVHAGTSTKPNKGVLAGWNRVKRSDELRTLLSDRNAIREAITKSAFVRDSWFTLEKLLGATNKSGAYIVQSLLDGCYIERSLQKTRSVNRGSGVDHDPNRKTSNGF